MSSKNSSKSSSERGNSITLSSSNNDKKQISPAIGWCFTVNNYTDEMVEKFQSSIHKLCKLGFFNKEVGSICGTPHLQGYIEFKTKSRPLNVFPSGVHWEKAKGCKDANFKYCSKDANGCIEDMTFSYGYKLKTKIKIIEQLYPWQKKIEDAYLEPPDDRTIHWLWEEVGNIGKTQFIKYMVVKYGVLFACGGKYADIINLVFNQDMDACNGIFFNIPRANKGSVSYSALESIKDGIICNTKYETGSKVFNSPHLFVFANFPPSDKDLLSSDRWDITYLGKGVPPVDDIVYDVVDSDDDVR